jgi:hypothetical protein
VLYAARTIQLRRSFAAIAVRRLMPRTPPLDPQLLLPPYQILDTPAMASGAT